MKIFQDKKISHRFYVGIVIFLLAIRSYSAWAQAEAPIPTGRYLTVENQPLTAQSDLLSPIIQVHFLSNIQTVGDAINDILRYSGYALIESQQQSTDLQETLKKPLPFVDRNLGPISLRQALIVLAGSAFDLSVDPLHRTINFQLKSKFEKRQHAVMKTSL